MVLRSERGLAASEYAGILAVVAAVLLAIVALGLDGRVSGAVRTAVCQVLGGDCEREQAALPDRCLVGQTTTSAHANVFVAFVQVDKDSIVIREDFSDGTSKFTIVDDTEAAGELFAGARAKVGKFGFNASAEAMLGAGLAGGQVFEFDDPDDADAFQDSVQAAGGFDGIVRDLASYDDEVPSLGWDNPVGGLNDWALDQLGVDDDEDLPDPTETYVEGSVFLNGAADAGGGLGVVDAEIAGLIEGAGVVKVVSSGENEGDVELAVQLDAEAGGSLTVATLGGGLGGDLGFTATISLDAQNGYAPDKLVLKGNGQYTGSLDHRLLLEADELADLSEALEKVSLSAAAGEGQGLELSAELDLDDPENLSATLRALTGSDPVPLALALNEDGTLGLDTYDVSTEETDGEIKVGLGVGGGAGGSSSTETQSGRSGYARPPGGTFEPRVCLEPSSS